MLDTLFKRLTLMAPYEKGYKIEKKSGRGATPFTDEEDKLVRELSSGEMVVAGPAFWTKILAGPRGRVFEANDRSAPSLHRRYKQFRDANTLGHASGCKCGCQSPWQHHASRHHQANASVTSLVLVAVSKELLIDLMPSEERIPRQQLTRRMRPQRSQRRSQRLSRTMEALLRKSPRQNGRSANRRLSQRPSRRRNLMKISVWMTTKVSHSIVFGF